MFQNLDFVELIIRIPVLLIAFTIHECSHGLAAYKLGDSTAKLDGRLSLNPLRHIDPLGAIMLLVVGFGWAKAVMVNPYNLKNPKQDMAVISIAGPLSNFILAAVFTVLAVVTQAFLPVNTATNILNQFLMEGLYINIGLGVFNMLPIPPLDGSKVLGSVLPDSIYRVFLGFDSRYGMILFIILMFTGVLSWILRPMTSVVINAYISAASWLFTLIS
ncbi:MAG: site-2 protease family protein [Clostridiales bacterium]|jgi:Zn-dependent protease|nr:site-2 protease family protein [Clostridiales bacterium]